MSAWSMPERATASPDRDLRQAERVDVDERSLAGPADRRAGGGDDDGFGHDALQSSMSSSVVQILATSERVFLMMTSV